MGGLARRKHETQQGHGRSSVVVTEVDNLERVEREGRRQTNPRAHEVSVAELADKVEVCEAEAAVVGWRRGTFST